MQKAGGKRVKDDDGTRKAVRLAVVTGGFLGASAAGWLIYLFQSVAGLEYTALSIALSSTVAAALYVREVFAERDRAREWVANPPKDEWRPCVIESPYAGDVERHTRYLQAAMHWCLHNGYAPFASHGLYTQPGVLDDLLPVERRLGIDAGKAVGKLLPVRLVFTDEGVTPSMQEVLDEPVSGQIVVPMKLGSDWEAKQQEQLPLHLRKKCGMNWPGCDCDEGPHTIREMVEAMAHPDDQGLPHPLDEHAPESLQDAPADPDDPPAA